MPSTLRVEAGRARVAGARRVGSKTALGAAGAAIVHASRQPRSTGLFSHSSNLADAAGPLFAMADRARPSFAGLALFASSAWREPSPWMPGAWRPGLAPIPAKPQPPSDGTLGCPND
jgi:hypothetical protein